jgi:hypothetical protein
VSLEAAFNPSTLGLVLDNTFFRFAVGNPATHDHELKYAHPIPL